MTELPHVLLASQSPRRQNLMEAARIPFDLLSIEVVETYPDDMPIDLVAEYLAVKKGKAALKRNPDATIVAADTVVVHRDEILGKPRNVEHAVGIIQRLAGSTHIVITGVCIITSEKIVHFNDISKVHLAPMTEKEIRWYVETYSPLDKAGAYGIQDWIGHCKVDRIEGSYNNIMGLPTHRLYQELQAFGVGD